MRKNKIRILHVAQAAGGVDRYIRMLLKYLDKEKFENIEKTVKPYKAQIGSEPTENLVGLIFLRFFKFICEKSCPRLDIGRHRLAAREMAIGTWF